MCGQMWWSSLVRENDVLLWPHVPLMVALLCAGVGIAERAGCHDACHVPGLAPIFLFSLTITSPSFPSVCALEGLLFCDVISLTHICVLLLRPMTVVLGLTHPSSLIYDMTSSSLTRCILSRL